MMPSAACWPSTPWSRREDRGETLGTVDVQYLRGDCRGDGVRLLLDEVLRRESRSVRGPQSSVGSGDAAPARPGVAGVHPDLRHHPELPRAQEAGNLEAAQPEVRTALVRALCGDGLFGVPAAGGDRRQLAA